MQARVLRFGVRGAVLLLVAAVAVTVVVTRWWVSASWREPGGSVGRSDTFLGVIVSVYSDGGGGCVRADVGQGQPTAPDANCGEMFLVPGVSIAVGQKVRATSVDSELPDGEAVQGYIIGPVDR